MSRQVGQRNTEENIFRFKEVGRASFLFYYFSNNRNWSTYITTQETIDDIILNFFSSLVMDLFDMEIILLVYHSSLGFFA